MSRDFSSYTGTITMLGASCANFNATTYSLIEIRDAAGQMHTLANVSISTFLANYLAVNEHVTINLVRLRLFSIFFNDGTYIYGLKSEDRHYQIDFPDALKSQKRNIFIALLCLCTLITIPLALYLFYRIHKRRTALKRIAEPWQG